MTIAQQSILSWKIIVPICLLVLFWLWESWFPFFGWREKRLWHATHNLLVALFNSIVLFLVFGVATFLMVEWTDEQNLGLLRLLGLSAPVTFVLALLLLDAWMYVWHWANHRIPFLWRFHRMHHSDNRMDVTSAMRFHLGEQSISILLRLVLVPLLGLTLWQLVVYDLLVNLTTQFHHADISLGKWDRWLRALIVTPDMHKVHHSRIRPETDSNYSTLFSMWDRLARSFRMRQDPKSIEFGLEDYDDSQWQTFWGMLKTPLRHDSTLKQVSSEGKK